MSIKIALNAGHGLKTAGKRCLKKLDKNETREWVLNSRICELIEDKLKSYEGYELIRLDDPTGKKDVPLKDRTNKANAFKADFYLSIHHNAGVNGGSGGGIATYVYTKASKTSIEWQNDLYNALIAETKLKGNRSDGTCAANLHECRESDAPCVLIECGFMDSKTDVPIILTDKFAEQVANACVEVIIKKAKLKKKVVKTTNTKPSKSTTKKDNIVLEWQNAAIADGYNQKKGYFKKYGADGKWGKESEYVAEKAICKKRLIYTNKNLTKIVQKTVGVKADGKFGKATKDAVIKWQKKNGLKADGVVGISTWKKILNV
jgi:N-acetylmuramoyl-L-alanine amidase